MYEPEENPLKGLHSVRDADEIDEIVFRYLEMWRDDEGFSDYNIMLREGDDEMAAAHLVNAGAIDPKNCVPTCAAIERRIVKMAKAFKALTPKQEKKRYNDVFKGSTVYACPHCNHHSFVNDDDLVDAEDMVECTDCGKPVTGKPW